MTALEHPVWCDRNGCAERGHHESEPVRANADQGAESIEHRVAAPGDQGANLPLDASELLIVRAVLRQHIGQLPVWVEIVGYDVPGDDHAGLLLTPLQARLLAAGIRMLLRIGVL